VGFTKAIVSLPSDPRIGRTARGDEVRIVARGSETGGTIGIFEAWPEPGTGPDWHVHTRETEVFHVVSGSFRFGCGEQSFEAGPGATVTLPAHIPHQWKNIGTTRGQVLTVVTPAGFEEHFVEVANMAAVTDEAMAALDEKYGILAGYLGGDPPTQ
jgi:mannose-6-phosphate isomerase-like protein (cupin superfamily)